jgi:hypothetical protein
VIPPDHEPPQTLAECPACGGEGCFVTRITVYELGCGFPHDDSHEETCTICGGGGFIVVDVEADKPEDDE